MSPTHFKYETEKNNFDIFFLMVQGSCSLCHETSLQMSTTNRKLNSYELSSLTNFECSLRFHAHLWAVFEKNAQLCGQEKHTERFLVFNSRRSKRDLRAQKWLTCNFPKWYPYIIQQRGNSILGSLPFLWYKRNKYFKKRDKAFGNRSTRYLYCITDWHDGSCQENVQWDGLHYHGRWNGRGVQSWVL